MFREDKATQLAAYIIEKTSQCWDRATLLMMMYACDRAMILQRGAPVTYDKWFATPDGPALDATQELIQGKSSGAGYWNRHIIEEGCDVTLTGNPGDDALSESEEEVADQVFQMFNGLSHTDAVALARQMFPECAKTHEGGSYLIAVEDILKAGGILTPANLEGVRAQFEMNELLHSKRAKVLV